MLTPASIAISSLRSPGTRGCSWRRRRRRAWRRSWGCWPGRGWCRARGPGPADRTAGRPYRHRPRPRHLVRERLTQERQRGRQHHGARRGADPGELADDLLRQPPGGRGRAGPAGPGGALSAAAGAVRLGGAGDRRAGPGRNHLRADRGRRRRVRHPASGDGVRGGGGGPGRVRAGRGAGGASGAALGAVPVPGGGRAGGGGVLAERRVLRHAVLAQLGSSAAARAVRVGDRAGVRADDGADRRREPGRGACRAADLPACPGRHRAVADRGGPGDLVPGSGRRAGLGGGGAGDPGRRRRRFPGGPRR